MSIYFVGLSRYKMTRDLQEFYLLFISGNYTLYSITSIILDAPFRKRGTLYPPTVCLQHDRRNLSPSVRTVL